MTRVIESTQDFSDSVLPVQYYDSVRRSHLISGEYRLLWAVLEAAIGTYLANKGRSNPAQRRNFQEIQRWFTANHQHKGGGLFDYRTVCELLEVDPDRLLEGLSVRSVKFRRGRHRIKALARGVAV
jgi:hypothetical protein